MAGTGAGGKPWAFIEHIYLLLENRLVYKLSSSLFVAHRLSGPSPTSVFSPQWCPRESLSATNLTMAHALAYYYAPLLCIAVLFFLFASPRKAKNLPPGPGKSYLSSKNAHKFTLQ